MTLFISHLYNTEGWTWNLCRLDQQTVRTDNETQIKSILLQKFWIVHTNCISKRFLFIEIHDKHDFHEGFSYFYGKLFTAYEEITDDNFRSVPDFHQRINYENTWYCLTNIAITTSLFTLILSRPSCRNLGGILKNLPSKNSKEIPNRTITSWLAGKNSSKNSRTEKY